MKDSLRLSEYKVLLYRFTLCYLFYFISRILFYAFNSKLFAVSDFSSLLDLCFYGLAFDTTALLYINVLFILLSIIPTTINRTARYQKGLMILYFVTNIIAYATNFIDIIYYRFSQVRSTKAALDLLSNEQNKKTLLFNFITTYWYVLVLFIVCSVLWVWLYNLVKIKPVKQVKALVYFSTSVLAILAVSVLIIVGIRGGVKKSTRPINLVDAYKYVKVPNQGDVVLNTPFAIMRTLNSNNFKSENWVSQAYINQNIKPIKQYDRQVETKPNVVVIILESMGREYWGSMNVHSGISNFVSYTPFLDSLSKSSLIFTNAYANGRQSIHGMSSVLAGIPSFKDAFTSSPYAKQNIQSLVSISNELNFETSFFHGAANGSMGFQGFASILGFDKYYGRTEYNNDDDFDGTWGIWDEPFFQFMAKTIDTQPKPFMTTLFTVSSHEPFRIPEQYKNRFKGGPLEIDKCVQYTDNALRNFFNYAQKQAWFKNTIFVITADHTNQTFYPEYSKAINRFAVPILLYSANENYNLKGENNDWASQIDIYPTIIDLIGYNKPFRSWGRSLVSNLADETPRVINSTGAIYQFMQGNYIYLFDGKEISGVYATNDKGLEHDLKKNLNAEMKKGMLDCKAFVQDYMNRISQRKLNSLE